MTSPTDKYKDLSFQDIKKNVEQDAEQGADKDAAFGKRLATHFAPAPMTPNQRAAFDIALAARLEKRRQRTFLVPAFATVAAAAVVIFTLNGGLGLNPHTPSSGAPTGLLAKAPVAEPPMPKAPIESGAESADSLARDEWAYDLLAFNDPMAYGDESHELNELDETHGTEDMYASNDNDEESDTDVFPDEYLAIESVFLEG